MFMMSLHNNTIITLDFITIWIAAFVIVSSGFIIVAKAFCLMYF